MENKLGIKLKEFRAKKFGDAALRRVADDIGVGYTYIHRMETGMHVPSDEILNRLAEGYGLSTAETVEIYALAHSPEYAQVLSKILKEKNDLNQVGAVFFRRAKDKDN